MQRSYISLGDVSSHSPKLSTPTRLAGMETLTWEMTEDYTPEWYHSGWHGHPASLLSHPSALPHSLSDQRSPKRLRKENKKPIQNCASPSRSPSPRANKRNYGSLAQQHHCGRNKQYSLKALPWNHIRVLPESLELWQTVRSVVSADRELQLRRSEAGKCCLTEVRLSKDLGKRSPRANLIWWQFNEDIKNSHFQELQISRLASHVAGDPESLSLYALGCQPW